MKQTIKILLILVLLNVSAAGNAAGGDTVRLTMSEVIRMAQESSPQAVQARNTFESAWLSYRSYRASMLPSLSLSSSPSLNRSTNYVTLPDGSELFARSNSMRNNLSLDLSQNVWFTGGTISLSGSLSRLDQLGDNPTHSYYSQPLQLSFSQSLNGYNSFKWSRKTEPIEYRRARKQYAETMELVASQAAMVFFNLVSAQTELEIAQLNHAATDTLYTYGLGRYNIGTITENELLQLELNKLNSETSIMSSQMSFDDAVDQLRNFLNLTSDTQIEVVTTDSIPHFTVPLDQAMELARQNSPDIESMELSRLNSESNLAYYKSQAGFKASIYMRLGLAQTADELPESFRNLNDEQSVSVSVSIPILDWGRARGRVKIAQNNLELTRMHIEQNEVSFEKMVTRTVSQFNLQERQVEIARRTMQTAQHRYEVARHLYVSGSSTILDLNSAITAKDSAYRGYVSALSRYWQLYYTIRSLTAYDFDNNEQIEQQVEYGR
ncbi:MAG: TolC family protein [Bacteroidaceae bacterium]|nr:TolC family protein [Bacteroidaceae bacterium]